MSEVTVDTLKQRWTNMLARADESAACLPECYRELKKIVYRVNHETVDIDDYFPLARRLTHLMETIGSEKQGVLFEYFISNIDPAKRGSAHHFRFMCSELQGFLSKIDQFRASKRRLKLVK